MLDRRFSTTWRSSAEELRTVLTALARKHRVPGAQLAVRSGGETLVVQTGVEREGRPRRMRASSKVPVGSITKAFTATVAMMLVADDDLELDAPISEVLPKVPGADALTLRRLLSHTAGLPCDPAEESASRLRNQDLAEPVCPPSTAFSYS
ncbi:MAG TPA: serine hydrolase domain-containing protein, partial [Amycolatopsis sp.]|nr:serine hydrolase domain-containing protein [Amycolatopsis sp.]